MTTDTALITSSVDPDVSAAMVVYERLKPLKEALGIETLTDSELQLFAMVAHHTGLDPFTRQLYAVKRQGKVTHQTGIDGYRSTAERKTGQYAGSDEATYEDCPCGAEPKPHPAVARVIVHRILPSGHIVDQTGVARWHELYPGPGADGFMWRKMPYNQLAKCAEANGLRKAFPRVLGGVYIAEEMEQGETIEGTVTVLPTAAERIAARRAAAEAPAELTTGSDDTQHVKPADQQEAPVPADSGSAPAEPVILAEPMSEAESGDKPAFCLVEDPNLETGPCALAPGHAGPHKNRGGVWPAA